MPNIDLEIDDLTCRLNKARVINDKKSEIGSALRLANLYKEIDNREMEAQYLSYISAFYQTEAGYRDFPKAIDYLELALSIYKGNSDWLNFYRKINSLATIYEEMNNIQQAILVSSDAIALFNDTMVRMYPREQANYLMQDVNRIKYRLKRWKGDME